MLKLNYLIILGGLFMKKHYFAIYTVILLLITSSLYMDKNCFNFDLISLKSKMSNNDYLLDLEKSKLKYMFDSPQLMETHLPLSTF